MNSLRIVLNGDGATREMFDPPLNTHEDVEQAVADGRLIHLGNGAEITVASLDHGMESGLPSVGFAFKLPDGTVVQAETTMRLFQAAAAAFEGKYGRV